MTFTACLYEKVLRKFGSDVTGFLPVPTLSGVKLSNSVQEAVKNAYIHGPFSDA